MPLPEDLVSYSTAVIARDEMGILLPDWPVECGEDEVRVNTLSFIHDGNFERVREVIVFTHGGYGGKFGGRVTTWRPWPELGYTGVRRGQLEQGPGAVPYREQVWERKGTDSE